MQTRLLHIDNADDADVIWLIFGLYLLDFYACIFNQYTKTSCCKYFVALVAVAVAVVASATTECFQFN